MSGSRQYPPQTGPYTVKAKGGADWQSFDTVRLEISVGQPYHEGAKMAATLEWARTRFRGVAVLVNDTLQRFNLMFDEGLSEAEAFRRTQAEGAAWIARNRNGLVQARADIYRWDDWKHHADYKHSKQQAEALYNSNAQFRAAIDSAIAETWDRRVGKHRAYTPARKEEFSTLSRRYLLEETGVFSLIFRTIHGVSAYPGSFHEMWDMFVDQDVPEAPKGLKQGFFTRIDFLRNNISTLAPPVAGDFAPVKMAA